MLFMQAASCWYLERQNQLDNLIHGAHLLAGTLHSRLVVDRFLYVTNSSFPLRIAVVPASTAQRLTGSIKCGHVGLQKTDRSS